MNIKPDGHYHSFVKNICHSSRGLQFDCQQLTANVTSVTDNPILGLYKQLHLQKHTNMQGPKHLYNYN